MTRNELINQVAARTGASSEDTERTIDVTIQEIAGALERGDLLRWPTFGTLLVADQKPRRLRNPQSGELMTVPGKKRIVFRASDMLKAAVQPKPKQKPKKKAPAPSPATKPSRRKPKMSGSTLSKRGKK